MSVTVKPKSEHDMMMSQSTAEGRANTEKDSKAPLVFVINKTTGRKSRMHLPYAKRMQREGKVRIVG